MTREFDYGVCLIRSYRRIGLRINHRVRPTITAKPNLVGDVLERLINPALPISTVS